MCDNELNISTDRLDIIVPSEDDLKEIMSYHVRNRRHLSQWEPLRKPEYYRKEHWESRIKSNIKSYNNFSSVYLYGRLKDKKKIVCACSYTNIIRGVFQSCFLGFSVDQTYEGMGYMSEAVRASIKYIFSKGIHRVQANYMPRNEKSAKLLKRLNLTIEGYARDYLFIDGKWEDHILTSLTNVSSEL